ncbi:MAG TPA: secondary thiamine-phosphate synthase enzyme YjbQ [Spirochaetota bacterium]|nr:secondary thiamine-phosphate synthase enzyme YjbQ [Spirochaetota bacterium]
MFKTFTVATDQREALFDITAAVKQAVQETGTTDGLVNVYVQGATAAVMIQENWDESVQQDVIAMLQKLVPRGVWRHDRQDGNGDAHLKSGMLGPSETIPLVNGKLALSTWQNIFLCEFDGPRDTRTIAVTVMAA